MDFVGLAASIATLLRLGHEVILRLKALNRDENPFLDVTLRLALLLEKLNEISVSTDTIQKDDKRINLLQQAISGCLRQVEELEAILVDLTLSAANSSSPSHRRRLSFSRSVRAVKATAKEGRIRRIEQSLRAYESTLTFFFVDLERYRDQTTRQDGSGFQYEVPAMAVDHFIGRVRELDMLKSILGERDPVPSSRYDRTAVLVGLGGQGKTQLAFEFCKRSRASCSILYLNGVSPNILQQSVDELVFKITGFPPASHATSIEELYEALDARSTPYIIFIDNLDSPQSYKSVSSILPHSEISQTLITTRSALCESLGHAIYVDSMQINDAIELLDIKVGRDSTSKDNCTAKAIVDGLGRLPLAIDQAAAYIRERHLSYSLFLEHYKMRKSTILRKVPEIGLYRRTSSDSEKETRLSVFATWELSFHQLSTLHPDHELFVHVLTLAAFLNYRKIGQVFYEAYWKCASLVSDIQPSPNILAADQAWDPLTFQDAVVVLRNVSLIDSMQFSSTGVSFSLHPLVADWLMCRLDHAARLKYVGCIAETLSVFTKDLHFSMSPYPPFEDANEMLGHIETFVACAKDESSEQRQVLMSRKDIIPNLCHFYVRHSRYDQAEEMASNYLTKDCSIEDEISLRAMLGKIYTLQGDITSARHQLKLAHDRQLQSGGTTNNPETMLQMIRLGFCHFTISELDEAETLYTSALHGYESIYGRIHPATLNCMRMLGEINRLQGNYTSASKFLLTSASDVEQLCGPRHFRTAIAKSGVAALHRDLGDYTKAHATLQESLAIHTENFGPDSTHARGAKVRIGFVLEDEQKADEARSWYLSALDVPALLSSPAPVVAHLRRLIKDFRYEDGMLARALDAGQAAESEDAGKVLRGAIARLKGEELDTDGR